jgi:hypothetical protein
LLASAGQNDFNRVKQGDFAFQMLFTKFMAQNPDRKRCGILAALRKSWRTKARPRQQTRCLNAGVDCSPVYDDD